MKKFICLLLIAALTLTFVGCSMTSDSAKKVKSDYEAFSWSTATNSAKLSKANALLARIEKLPASERTEVATIKAELTKIVNDLQTPSPSASPSPNPSATPSANPSATPSATASPSPSPAAAARRVA